MSLDDIKPSADTVMTEVMVRLFKSAGCSPTACHACSKRIKVGMTFKLVPHKTAPDAPMNDEMCCADCDEASLIKRDKREQKASERRRQQFLSTPRGRVTCGFSRPSIVKDEP